MGREQEVHAARGGAGACGVLWGVDGRGVCEEGGALEGGTRGGGGG